MRIDLKLISGTLSKIQTAELTIQKEGLEKQLREEYEKNIKTVHAQVLEMYKSFKHLCINLARADGQMNMKEVEALTIEDFYFLKQNVHDLHKRRTKKITQQDASE